MHMFKFVLLTALVFLLLVVPACRPQEAPSPAGGPHPVDAAEAARRILAYVRDQNPNLVENFAFEVQEQPVESAWEMLRVQVFRAAGDLFDQETFLLRGDEVIQVGTAFGGSGVNSLVVSDLDQDGAAELLFAYSFGSGIHQSRIGMFAPAYDEKRIFEASHGYLGDLFLEKDGLSEVRVLASQARPGEASPDAALTLGRLSLSRANGQPVLKLEPAPGLPPEVTQSLYAISPLAPPPTVTSTPAVPSSYPEARTVAFLQGGTSAYFQETISVGAPRAYVLEAVAGQTLLIAAASPGSDVYLAILELQQGEPLIALSDRRTDWTGALPSTGAYQITLTTENAQTDYFLHIEIPVDIFPQEGEDTVMVEGYVAVHSELHPNVMTRVRYLVHAAPGREIGAIRITSNDANQLSLAVTGQGDGQPYKRFEVSGTDLNGPLPLDQGYYVDVYSLGVSTNFKLEISLH